LAKRDTLVFVGKVINVRIETAHMPNGKSCTLEIVRHPGGAAVVAVDEQQRVCLLRQYRHVADDWLWELPAGRLEEGEQPLDTARRELEEEAGARAGEWQELGRVFTSPGVFSEVIHLYLARGLQLTAHQHEEYETIEVHWLPWSEALELADRGAIIDAKTIIGLYKAHRLVRTSPGSP